MKKYLATVKNAGVTLLIASIFLGIAYLFGIDLNAKRYICILNCQIKLEKNYLLIRNILYEYF